jgi:hypothetical protein
LRGELEQAQTARLAAEEADDGLKGQLEQLRQDTSATVDNVKQEAAAHLDAVRKETAAAAEASMQAKVAEPTATGAGQFTGPCRTGPRAVPTGACRGNRPYPVRRRRLRVWIDIHRQRKEWDAKEKEMVPYRLVDRMGRASAANILGITVRELDKLVAVFELSEKFTSLRDPSAAITWAHELMGVSKKFLTPSVVDAVVKQVNQKQITNSKDLRKLLAILPYSVARAYFLNDEGDLDSAALRLAPLDKKAGCSLPGDLEAGVEAMKNVTWTALEELMGDCDILKKNRRCQSAAPTIT